MKLILVILLSAASFSWAQTKHKQLNSFLNKFCSDCHADGMDKGGLDFEKLEYSLNDKASFAKWESVFDRVMSGEMPPKKKKKRPSIDELMAVRKILGGDLFKTHAERKGTVLRRLNRMEYENTLNDIFGTSLKIAAMLPEDGRSHEFDNVGKALGISMVQLQKYMKAINLVMDSAIEKFPEQKKINPRKVSYLDDKGSKKFIGDAWKELADGAVVRFGSGGYPSGMMRGTGVRESGFYKITVSGYGHQTKKDLPFSVGGSSFKAGSEKPIYAYFSYPPDKETSVSFITYIEKDYMIAIEPYGISDPDRYHRKKKGLKIDTYKGPGLAIKHVQIEGPVVNEFPSRGHKLIFDGVKREEIIPRNPRDRERSWYKPKFKITSDNPEKSASGILTRIAQKAFRKNNPDISPYLKLFKKEMANGENFEYAVRSAIIAIFCSTDFLYLREKTGALDNAAIASRLSYFLNRTNPDTQLTALASQNKLTDKNIREAELERLLKKPKFDRFIADFTDAWLNLREIDFTSPDKRLFPEFDPYLRYSMPLETRAFVKELVQSNLSVSNIVKSNFAMLNDRLAEHYNISGVNGTKIRKVKLPKDSLRGGIISQAGILKVSANGSNTSPVLRGVWVLERIMGITPPPPPPGVPGVEPDIRGAETLRELLDKHRDSTNCNSCHTKIDPLGFALEIFNPVGSYRENFRTNSQGKKVDLTVHGKRVHYRLGHPVDASGEFSDGTKFTTFKEFREYLSKDKETLAKAVTKKLLTFATGREMGFSDRKEIKRIVKTVSASDYRLRDIITEIINSEIFLTK